MTLRERLHQQINTLDARRLTGHYALLTNLTRPQRVERATATTSMPDSFCALDAQLPNKQARIA